MKESLAWAFIVIETGATWEFPYVRLYILNILPMSTQIIQVFLSACPNVGCKKNKEDCEALKLLAIKHLKKK